LVVGYIGLLEVWSEDGTEMYLGLNSKDHQALENSLMESVFMSSSTGYTVDRDQEFLMLGTSKGDIFQFSVN
jgi:hypothetical protein